MGSGANAHVSFLITRVSVFGTNVSCVQGLGEHNEIPRKYVEHIRKFLPIMRAYSEHQAADHLERWIEGRLEFQPLLDLSVFFDQDIKANNVASRPRALPHQLRLMRRAGADEFPQGPALCDFSPKPCRIRFLAFANLR